MSGIADFYDLMTQTLTVAPVTGRDSFDNKAYGAAVTYRCRLVGKRRQVVNAQGEVVTSEQTAYLGTASPVDPEALVTLSTADAGSTEPHAVNPRILATGRYPDEAGHHHSVIFL